MTSGPVYDSPSQEALDKAKAEVEARFLDPNSSTKAHTIFIGPLEKDGQETGEIGIVVVVEDKVKKIELPRDEYIPPCIKVQTSDPNTPDVETVKIDIQVAPQPTVELLRLSDFEAQALGEAHGINEWRACFNAPIPGGVQIAPKGADFVGTLACAVRLVKSGGYGALTNYHVASLREQIGIDMCQPSGRSGPFATVAALCSMDFRPNGSNRIDAALLDTWRTDGPFAPGCHTVKPEQFKIGKIDPAWLPLSALPIGTRLQKSGRTTGHQFGRIAGVGVTTHVGYDNGTARFVNQLMIRGENGLFSNPGDSGSLILNEERKPAALLFAGGGGNTIANPIQFVVEDLGIDFFAD